MMDWRVDKVELKIKYNGLIEYSTFEDYCHHYLIGKVWKLLPLREENKDWQSYLTSLNQEIVGANEILLNNKYYFGLVTKLEGLRFIEDFTEFRKMIFECTAYIEKLPKKIGESS